MKILVVSNLYPPHVIGGYELNCRHIVQALAARGHQLLVATTPSPTPGPADPPNVRRCLRLSAFQPSYAEHVVHPMRRHLCDTSDFDNVAALHGLLREFVPDVVFLWNLHGVGGLHLIDFLNTNGVPWSIYLGDRVFEQLRNASAPHVNMVFRGHDPSWFASGAVMVVSEHLADEDSFLGRFTYPRPPVIVHGYTTITGLLPPQRLQQYRCDGMTRFASAGRVSEHKGIGLICDAAAILLAQGLDRFSIDIFGEGDVTHYVNHANVVGAASHIHFRGAVPQAELYAAYRDADLFLFPTWSREPLGFAPFEAAAQGCVPIVTADCGCSERIVDGVHGVKIPRTAQALAEAMARAIRGELDLPSMGAAAAAMVRQDLTLEGHVDKLLAVLEAERRPWDPTKLDRPDAVLLPFIKHHLSVALRFGANG